LASNTYGQTPSVSFQVVIGPSHVSFETNGYFWATNYTDTVSPGVTITNNQLSLAVGSGSSARSAWFASPLYIGNFYASFVYQDVGGGGADGMAFVLQNDPRGTAAIGGAGGSLGVSGITPSAEIEVNIYTNNTPGVAYHVNGANTGYTSVPMVASGDPVLFQIRYANGVAQLNLTDETTAATFSASLPVGDLTAQLGKDTAYVGFTGADGGTKSTQTVSNFVYIAYPQLMSQVVGSTLVFSWLPETGGFILQTTSDLTLGPSGWQTVTNPVTVVNGKNQVTVPINATGNQFYRLILP
jgi:hypothetical protein